MMANKTLNQILSGVYKEYPAIKEEVEKTVNDFKIRMRETLEERDVDVRASSQIERVMERL